MLLALKLIGVALLSMFIALVGVAATAVALGEDRDDTLTRLHHSDRDEFVRIRNDYDIQEGEERLYFINHPN